MSWNTGSTNTHGVESSGVPVLSRDGYVRTMLMSEASVDGEAGNEKTASSVFGVEKSITSGVGYPAVRGVDTAPLAGRPLEGRGTASVFLPASLPLLAAPSAHLKSLP